MTTLLPAIDPDAAYAFWQRYLAATGHDPEPSFVAADAFGDSVELADDLIDLVVNGPKRATAGAVADYAADAEVLPQVGDRWIACDGSGRPRALIRVTDVRVGPLSSVDEAFAWDEGEGDRTRADWLRGHTQFFLRRFAALGLAFHDEIPVAFERFEVLYTEPSDRSHR
jgi:uncharacterized protein YhfF